MILNKLSLSVFKLHGLLGYVSDLKLTHEPLSLELSDGYEAGHLATDLPHHLDVLLLLMLEFVTHPDVIYVILVDNTGVLDCRIPEDRE